MQLADNTLSKIAVFDSGLGGLTVLKQFLEHHPNHDYVFFGDNARVPYGNKSQKMINHYTEQAIRFLLTHKPDLITIACNTASAYAIENAKSIAGNIPVIGMIQPVVEFIKSNDRLKKIGVIGTQATVSSSAYPNALNGTKNIKSIACPLFVPYVESDMIEHKSMDLVIEHYLKDLKEFDALILACTHYPFLKKKIKEYLPNIEIIDTGYAAALKVKENSLGALNKNKEIKYFLSDDANNFIKIAEKYLDLEINNLEIIDIEKY